MAYESTLPDFRNRSKGVWAQTTALFRRFDVSDITLLERVRAPTSPPLVIQEFTSSGILEDESTISGWG